VDFFSRADLLRMLRVSAHQLSYWERAGLVPAREQYSYSDLVQVRKVSELCEKKVRPGVIRQSLDAMQKRAAGMVNPLLEAGVYALEQRVHFRHEGVVEEPIAGQFAFDFAPTQTVVVGPRKEPPATPKVDQNSITDLFSRGIALEENPATQSEAIATYQRVLDLDPKHAAAHINLGTILYNRQEYGLAEQHYRRAIEADDRYALAYFDLGNVLDETGRVKDAIQSYQTALQLAPTYADAHYNLALSYEKTKDPRKALKHWRAYVKLDSTGPWAVHARSQIRRILQMESLKLVGGGGRS
jgi:tetratricopeptide (TPR) repeat protein